MSTTGFDRTDPAFQNLIDLFVSELDERIASIENAVSDGDLLTLRRIGHQLKGSSGCYGFDEITQPAAALQFACDNSESDAAIERAAARLVEVCRQVVAGRTPTPAGSAG
ncbi:MAG: Hpt domain-containing protein [Planctomycetota bacterium]